MLERHENISHFTQHKFFFGLEIFLNNLYFLFRFKPFNYFLLSENVPINLVIRPYNIIIIREKIKMNDKIEISSEF